MTFQRCNRKSGSTGLSRAMCSRSPVGFHAWRSTLCDSRGFCCVRRRGTGSWRPARCTLRTPATGSSALASPSTPSLSGWYKFRSAQFCVTSRRAEPYLLESILVNWLGFWWGAGRPADAGPGILRGGAGGVGAGHEGADPVHDVRAAPPDMQRARPHRLDLVCSGQLCGFKGLQAQVRVRHSQGTVRCSVCIPRVRSRASV